MLYYRKGSILISKTEQGLVNSNLDNTSGCSTPIFPIILLLQTTLAHRSGKYVGSKKRSNIVLIKYFNGKKHFADEYLLWLLSGSHQQLYLDSKELPEVTLFYQAIREQLQIQHFYYSLPRIPVSHFWHQLLQNKIGKLTIDGIKLHKKLLFIYQHLNLSKPHQILQKSLLAKASSCLQRWFLTVPVIN